MNNNIKRNTSIYERICSFEKGLSKSELGSKIVSKRPKAKGKIEKLIIKTVIKNISFLLNKAIATAIKKVIQIKKHIILSNQKYTKLFKVYSSEKSSLTFNNQNTSFSIKN